MKVNVGKMIFAWALAIGVFFAISALFMVTWNYTLPRLVHSVVGDVYNIDEAPGIEYWTAVVTLILIGFMFPSARSLNSLNTDYWYAVMHRVETKG